MGCLQPRGPGPERVNAAPSGWRGPARLAGVSRQPVGRASAGRGRGLKGSFALDATLAGGPTDPQAALRRQLLLRDRTPDEWRRTGFHDDVSISSGPALPARN